MLSHIFHISDLHIRKGDANECRYHEYKQVFDNLFISLKDQISTLGLQTSDYIFVVSGDIFHNKNVIGNHGLMLYKQFLEGLTALGRVILFHGNHDRNQNEINQPSLITSTVNINNLTILHSSQSFVIDDVGFSYLSIDDTLNDQSTSGRINELPTFPAISHQNLKYKIALFHGTFANVKLYNGTEVTDTQNPYPFKLLEEFNYALLGDIHLRQKGSYNNYTLWGYAGSLVQQNYGEDIINHGYMIWNIRNATIKEVNVYNEIGMVNLKSNADGNICLRIRGKYDTKLEDYIQEHISMFPKHIEIKLYNDVDLHNLFTLLEKHNITCNIVNKTSADEPSDTSTTVPTSNSDIDIKVDKDTLLQHFSQYLTPGQTTILSNIIKSYDNLLFNLSKFPPELQDLCAKMNKELSTSIDKCLKTDNNDAKMSYNFRIKYLEWENLYCYEGKNWINFDEVTHSTFSVAGNNATGKSAIYDVMTLSVWGDITTLKKNDLTSGIINSKHNDATTTVDIEINGAAYRIVRQFVIKTNKDHRCNKAHTYLYKYLPDGTVESYKQDNACNIEIQKLVGTQEDFLSSSMITQNVDCDILKMSYADCLSVIDKTFDIEYIYNLYDLMKSSSKKYKDFKKVIETKKEVYERLIVKQQASTDVDIDVLSAKLVDLEKQKEQLVDENNSIAVNINDTNLANDDYDKLIADLGTVTIQNDDEYQASLEKLNELKVLLKNIPAAEITKLASQIDASSIIPEQCNKPCELHFIQSEEKALAGKLQEPELLAKYKKMSKSALKTTLTRLTKHLTDLSDDMSNHNDKKPITVKSKMTMDTVLEAISKIYNKPDDGINELKAYCNTNKRSSCILPSSLKQHITYEEYKAKSIEHNALLKQIADLKTKLTDIDSKFKIALTKKSKLQPVNKPSDTITLKTSTLVKKELSKHNISALKKQINNDNVILEEFYKKQDDITLLEKQLKSYEDELSILNTKEEYKYNPECEYCCKRPWVCRKNELQIIIASMQSNIKSQTDALYSNKDYDYMDVYERCETNKKLLARAELLTEWQSYFIFKEADDALAKETDGLLQTKDILNKQITDAEDTIHEIAAEINTFNAHLFELYDIYNYIEWKEQYDDLENTRNVTAAEIKNINNWLVYNDDVKPRIEKLNELKKSYDKWIAYDNHNKIMAAYDYTQYIDDIDKYEKKQKYQELALMKPLIEKKMELASAIKMVDAEMKELNDSITKAKTINDYNAANNTAFEQLTATMADIEDTIQLFEIIVDKFKDYRKELYDKHILKKLVENANRHIKTLCHNNAKMFEVGYLITENKDIIHINWLVSNLADTSSSDGSRQQVISIKQASGFQQFAISMALRMSLFSSKRCTQLFIDEGFTACDKQNLSIVPGFLKGLLRTFNTVVIVSHIDIIQDSMDNTAYISYNSVDKASKIAYGCQVAVKQRRRKLAA